LKLTFSLILVIIIGLISSAALVRHHPQSADSTNSFEVELVTLRASGFEPQQITRPKGPFVLFLEDRSGKATSLFTLRYVKGEHVREVNTNRMKFEWHDVLNLPPGEYLLTNANSDSACHLTILP
jgi:hypothetical protein